MKTTFIIHKNYHAWQANNGYLLSNEDTKKLLSFGTIDELVNYAYLHVDKELAREINKRMK